MSYKYLATEENGCTHTSERVFDAYSQRFHLKSWKV